MPLDVLSRGGPLVPGQVAGSEAPNPYADTKRVYLEYPPEIFPMPGAQEFAVDVDFSSPAVGATEPAGLILTLPQGMVGIVRVFGYGIQTMTIATNVSWALLVNGGPVQGYTDRRFFPGNVPRVTASVDTFIRVPAGGTIAVRFTNVDGAAYTANANYSGWFWSEQEAKLRSGRP
jgi:hypothetical protein